jgi:hypothetical protein
LGDWGDRERLRTEAAIGISMLTVELLEQAIDVAKRAGYNLRQECLAGRGGGCELKGRKILFLDLDLSPDEQLEQVIATLRREPKAAELAPGPELRRLLE